MGRVDEEAVAYFESLLNDASLDWEHRLEKMIAWKKEHRGLKGVHCTVLDENATKEDIAKGLFLMMLSSAKGEDEDVTNEVL